MSVDPIATWLDAASSSPLRILFYTLAVFVGSAIPQAFAAVPLDSILFGFAIQLFMACVHWGALCWLVWFSVPVLFYYLYRFVFEETPKKDLFIGFSVSYFTFYGICLDTNTWLPLLLYAALWFLYWKAPKMLADRLATKP